MAVIKKRKKAVIKKGINFSYDPNTFDKQKYDQFVEIKDPQEILDIFGKEERFAFDTETHALPLKNHEIPENIVRRWVGKGKNKVPQDIPFCISFSNGKISAVIYDDLENNFEKFKKLKPLFENPKIEKIAHNAKYDMHQLANIGMRIRGKIHDTVILAKLVNENRRSFSLMDLVSKEKGVIKFEYMVDNYKKTHKVKDYSLINRDLMTQYACADTWNAWYLFVDEYPLLAKENLEGVYNNELQLMLALWEMERRGMKVNMSYREPLKDSLQKLCDDAEREIYEEAGSFFNINSGAQIYKVLIDKGVNQSIFKYTDKGNPCMDKFELERLAKVEKVPIVSKILEFRKYNKLLTTYAVGIYEQADSINRVHGSINQTEATTGRMSITKPALQTLPKKDKRIRKAFVPKEGCKLYFLDLDQVEYRLYAHYSKDPLLIERIKSGVDVHTATAALLFNKKPEEVDKDKERPIAKTINFGLVYGMGTAALANDLGISYDEAYDLKQRYFSALPNTKPFLKQIENVIYARGYIRNFYGRRRRLTHEECYKACNALIQGCAADYIKHKIVRIYKFLKLHNYKTRMINVVHDEIIFEVPYEEEHIVPTLRWLQSEFTTFRVPLTAGVEYGDPSWGEKIEPDNVGFEALTDEQVTEIDNYDLYSMGTAVEI